jgi:pilus assembly protein CpaB
VLLALAIACGGLAASEVSDRLREVEGQVGAPVPVVAAARDLPAGSELGPDDLTVLQVPERFAPRDAASEPGQVIGLSTAGPVAAGSPVTAGALGGVEVDGSRGALRRGERALEVAVAGGAALAEGAAPGSRVDVLVSTEPSTGAGRTFVALEDVELLALGGSGGIDDEGAGLGGGLGAVEGGAAEAASAIATLRVTLRQAVYLTAAQSFAREVRLLARPPGDRRRLGRATVTSDGL